MELISHSVRRLLAASVLATALFANAQLPQGMYIDPAPGQVSQLSEFIVTFDGEWALGSNRSGKITLTGPEGVVIPKIYNYSLGAPGYMIYFEDDAVITAPGDYTMTIPAGKFAIGGTDLAEAVINYTVIEGAVPQVSPVTINPEPGEVNALSTFTLTFDGEWSLGSNRNGKITLTGPEDVEIPAVMNTSLGAEGYLIYLDDDAVLTTPGQYTLTIPEGKFAIDDIDLPAARYQYTIVESGTSTDFPSYRIEPEPGTYATLNDGFALWLDTEKDITVLNSMISLTGPDGADIPLFVEVPTGMSRVVVIPTHNGDAVALATPGEYTLIFGFNSVKVGGKGNEEPMVFKYTVTGGSEWQFNITANPADDSTVSSLSNITITFVGARSVRVSDNARPEAFPVLTNLATGATVGATVFAKGRNLDVSLRHEVTEPGRYELLIAPGLLYVNDLPLEEPVMLYYTIDGDSSTTEVTYNVEPAAGNLGVDEPITISFVGDNIATVENNPFAGGKDMPHFVNQLGASNPSIQIAVVDSYSYRLTHQNPFEAYGVYTLVIPAGYFTMTFEDGTQATNSVIEVVYTVNDPSGISSITNDAIPAVMYNINGIRVDNPSAAGIYIHNGRKVVVK